MRASGIIGWLIGTPALLVPLIAAHAQQANEGRDETSGEIVIYGILESGAVAGVRAQDELTEPDIAAYGRNSVGELIEEVSGDVAGTGDEPVVLVNGRPVTSLADVSDLPTEAVSRVQILPRQAAAALGQPPGRRVLNIVIKNNLQQATLNTSGTMATAGKGRAWSGEASLLRQRNGNRTSIAIRGKRTEPLFESDRAIPATDAASLFGRNGNILPYPADATEIDPVLSALAGMPVQIAAVPAGRERPGLADFAIVANIADASDAPRQRTLVDARNSLEINANITRRLGTDTVISVNAKIDAEHGEGRNGPAGISLRIPARTPYTPFSRDVLLMRGLTALETASDSSSVNLGASLTTRIGKWRLSALGTLLHANTRRTIDTGIDARSVQGEILSGARNPFAAILADAAPMLTTRARAASDLVQLQAIATGPLAQLPAGPVTATIRAGARFDRFSARTADQLGIRRSNLARDEWNLFGNIVLPLLADRRWGALDVQANGAIREISVIGAVTEYGASTSWRPDGSTEISLAYNVQRIAPSAGLLTEPVVITPNYRVFDFIRGESVLVDFVTGGNPDLRTGQRDVLTASARLSPFAKLAFTLSGEFNHIRNRDLVGVLPPVSAAVQAAFPDRFQRDAGGILRRVDSRAVNFARETRDELRWGFDLRHAFSRTAAAGEDGEGSLQGAARDVRINARLFHTWTLRSDRVARAGLPVVDLLDGGAVGYGGGVAAHVVDGAVNLLRNGMGLELSGNWRSGNMIRGGTAIAPADLRFASHGSIDLRLFTNLAASFPDRKWARGGRITLEVTNLFDTRQRVRDGSGTIPARYHPFLLDPWGRTVRLTLRKIF